MIHMDNVLKNIKFIKLRNHNLGNIVLISTMDDNLRVNPRVEDMDPEKTEVEEFLQIFHGKVV